MYFAMCESIQELASLGINVNIINLQHAFYYWPLLNLSRGSTIKMRWMESERVRERQIDRV